jgi:hypothetical protein
MPRKRPIRPRAREPPLPLGRAQPRRQNTPTVAYLARGPTTSAKHQIPPYHPAVILPPPQCPRYLRTTPRPSAWSQQTRRRTTWLRTVDGGVRSASRGPDLRRTGARRAHEQASSLKRRLGFFAARGKVNFNLCRPHPLLYTGLDAWGNPQSNSTPSINGHVKNPHHFERGQRLHHLATPSAPDDLVELVPRRANVGAKAKTPPFARCLRQSRCTNGEKTTGRPLRSIPSPASLHQRRQDDWQTPPFVQCAEARRLLARSSHPAVSSNTKAHVQSGPL